MFRCVWSTISQNLITALCLSHVLSWLLTPCSSTCNKMYLYIDTSEVLSERKTMDMQRHRNFWSYHGVTI